MIVGIAATGLVTATTSPVFAAKQCDTGSDGTLTCSGGQGGRTVNGEVASGDPPSNCELQGTCSGGQGGHFTCEAINNCSDSGGQGSQSDSSGTTSTSDDTTVGGEGHRRTGDFSGGELSGSVGGSGEHIKGEGNN